jgi:hypothetical protein
MKTTPSTSQDTAHAKVRFLLLGGALVLAAGVCNCASAATQYVDHFGAGNWYSWDTRNTSGAQLVGTNDTNPAGSAYFGKSASTADDTAIEKQIIFMSEGQTINGGSGNNTLPASPAGSLGGLGYVRLDGTSSNSGKSDISYVDNGGIAGGGALLNSSFGLSYRYYIQPDTTFRTLGLNVSVKGTDLKQYTFSYTDPGAMTGWNTTSVDNSIGLFTLYINGVGQAEAGAAKTLADWDADPTYGSSIFGTGSEVFRLGFNIGSGQKAAVQYLDWMQTNLLNGGDTIDFVDKAPTVPDAGSTVILLASALTGLGAFKLRFKRS